MAPRLSLPPLPFALIAALGLGHVAFVGNRFTLTLHAVALGASPLQIGTLLGLVMVVPMFLAVHMGRWSDRFGYARVAAAGLLLLLAGGLLVAAWPVLPALYLAAVCSGTGYMLGHVAVNNAIGKATPSGRVTDAFSAMAMGFSLSGLTGPLLAGLVIDHAGHRFAFLLLCASTAASLLLLRRAGRRYPAEPAARAEQDRARVADLLRHPPLRKVLAVSALISMGWDLFAFLAPLQGVRAGLSATATGVVVGIFGAGTFAIRLVLPWVARRVGEWGAMRGALFVTALGYLAFPLLDSFAALLAAAFLLGMALGGGQPVSMSLLHMAAPAGRGGEAVGVRSAITAASQTVLPLVFGALGSAVGLGVVFWAAAGVLGVGGALASRAR